MRIIIGSVLMVFILCGSAVSAQTDTLFTHLDEQPTFPGGDMERMKYLARNLIYPAEARQQGHEGVVYLQFVVESDGSLTNITVLRGAFPSLDSAAVDVIRGMPKWIPGKRDGQSVRVMLVMPIHFQLPRNVPAQNGREGSRRRR